jgi:AraC-like DNA-binding protein
MTGVLHSRTVVDRDGVTIRDVSCRDASARGHASEHATAHTVVFVRRGCFVRTANGVESVCDPTVAYFASPGDEERFDHPHAGGDDCTAVSFDPRVAASLWGNEPALPPGLLPTSPRVDIEQRQLLTAGRHAGDPHELVEGAITIVAQALEVTGRVHVAAGRPATARARASVVNDARDALAADPDLSLPELARAVAVSPHHLSRVFRRATGLTISRHRMRLRARAVLERFADGERDLARLAADVGFADHSHLCRVMQAETGVAPSGLRALLGKQRDAV